MALLSARIGTRYAYARRGSSFIGLNAVLAVIGITIGIAALIVVLSVMNGVISQVRDNMLSMTAHVSIRPTFTSTIPASFTPADYLKQDKRIIAYAPIVYGQGMIGDGSSFNGVLLEGIDPNEQTKVSPTFARIPATIRNQLQPKTYNIILGTRLVERIGAHIGDKITVIAPQVTVSAAGILPRIKAFTLIGTFHSGHAQFDSRVALINMQDAQTLLKLPHAPSNYIIMLKNAFDAPHVRDELAKTLPIGLYASDWSRDQAELFGAMQMEKNAMFIILCLIILVAAFGLLSSMYMVVNEKRRDIAILRTMGMTRRDIKTIFLTQGMIFGGLGSE